MMKRASSIPALLLLSVAACGGDTSSAVDASVRPDAGIPDASVRPDASIPDASVSPDAGIPDATRPADGAPAVEDGAVADASVPGETITTFPFAAEVELTEPWETLLSVVPPVGESGYLVFEFDTADPEAIRLDSCDEDGCVMFPVRSPAEAWRVPTAFYEVGEGAVNRFSLRASRTLRFELRITFFPFEERANATNSVDAEGVPPRSASSVSVEARAGGSRPEPNGWIYVDVPSAGVLTVINADRCDPDLYGGVPDRCASLVSPEPDERPVARAGRVFLLHPNSRTSPATISSFVYFEADPEALRCSEGSHDGGTGSCVPLGTCAPGFHDGGLGRCLPEGECAEAFQLRAGGVCAGWRSLGTLPFYNDVNDEVLVLSDGKVLVNGSAFPDGYAPYVFDPMNERWAVTASPLMSRTRRFCPLSNGNVLTLRFGGFISTAPVDSEVIYDSSAGSFRASPSGQGIRWTRPDCVLLQSGETLVYESGAAWLYDPTAERWTSAGDGPLVNDPRGVEVTPGVVLAGGQRSGTNLSLTRWDQATNVWSVTSPWSHAREVDVPIIGLASHVYLFRRASFGSIEPAPGVTSYDPSTDTFVDTPFPERVVRVSSNGAIAIATTVTSVLLFQPGDPPQLVADVVDPPENGVPVVLGPDDYLLVGTRPLRYRAGN